MRSLNQGPESLAPDAGEKPEGAAACLSGPERPFGPPPDRVKGTSTIPRDGAILWQKPFLSGEGHMSHRIANLELHRFMDPTCHQPGDLHVPIFGTATPGFADGVRMPVGDAFRIQSPAFGLPLINPLAAGTDTPPQIHSL